MDILYPQFGLNSLMKFGDCALFRLALRGVVSELGFLQYIRAWSQSFVRCKDVAYRCTHINVNGLRC